MVEDDVILYLLEGRGRERQIKRMSGHKRAREDEEASSRPQGTLQLCAPRAKRAALERSFGQLFVGGSVEGTASPGQELGALGRARPQELGVAGPPTGVKKCPAALSSGQDEEAAKGASTLSAARHRCRTGTADERCTGAAGSHRHRA